MIYHAQKRLAESSFRGRSGAAVIPYDEKKTDYRTELLRAIVNLTYINEGAVQFKQAYELGIETRWLCGSAARAPKMVELAGKAAYQKKYGDDKIPIFGDYNYDMVHMTARADMIKPRMILMDEPSIGLAPRMIEEVYEQIQALNSRRGVTFLIVEQNVRKALGTAHRGYVLDLGVTRLEDTGRGLLDNEEVRKLCLGG